MVSTGFRSSKKSKVGGATEPKDTMFALFSMASDVDTGMFEPDYPLGWDEICIRLTRHCISQSNTLGVLKCVGMSRRSRALPS